MAWIIIIGIIVYLVAGYLLLRLLEELDVIDIDWDDEPIMWIVGHMWWPVIYLYWGIVLGFGKLNEKYFDNWVEKSAEWIRNKFNTN